MLQNVVIFVWQQFDTIHFLSSSLWWGIGFDSESYVISDKRITKNKDVIAFFFKYPHCIYLQVI